MSALDNLNPKQFTSAAASTASHAASHAGPVVSRAGEIAGKTGKTVYNAAKNTDWEKVHAVAVPTMELAALAAEALI